MGTATTFDVVSKSGGYEGGVITPPAQGFHLLYKKNSTTSKLKIEKL